MSLEGSSRRDPDPNRRSQRRRQPPTTPPPRRAPWAATSSRRAARRPLPRGAINGIGFPRFPPLPSAVKLPPTNPVVRFSPSLSLWAHPAPRVASASRSGDSGAARTPGSPTPQAGSSFVSPEPGPRGRPGTGPRGRGRRLLLPAPGARGPGPDDNENSRPRRLPGTEPREPRVGARSSSLRRPGAEEPGQAASCRGGPPPRLAREPTVRFAKPLPAPRAVVPAPKPPARFGNEISFLVLSAAHPVNVTLDGGPQRVSPSASVSPSVKWGQKLRGAPLAGLREQEGADGRRRAGGARHSPFGPGARGGARRPRGTGRARVRALHARPHLIPEVPSPGLGEGGGGSRSGPRRGSARPGRCPQVSPRPADAGRFDTRRSGPRGGPPCTPHHAEGGRTGDRGRGPPAREAPGLPAAPRAAGRGLRLSWRRRGGALGRDLGSSGVFIRLKHPQGADCGGGGQRGEGSRPEQTFQASGRFWAGLMGTEEGSTVPRGTPKGTPAPHFALY